MNPISIRQKVSRAIKNAPTYIDIYRAEDVWSEVDDAYIPGEPALKYSHIEGLLDNSSHSKLNIVIAEGGKISSSDTPKFYAVFDTSYDFKVGDYFIYKGNKYIVSNAVNILELDIYWELDLELEVL